MKKLYGIGASSLLMMACSIQNNVSFNNQSGNCADGTTDNAPYCMAVTIQNNAGGQNYISSTNFPINSLTLTLSGPTNVGFPNTVGSSYDPHNCLGSTVSPGQACTFYLGITSESIPVGQHVPVTVNANYSINNSLPWSNSSTTASSSTTVYETPALLITGTNGFVQAYNVYGFGTPFFAESGETVANSITNDRYYGYLYIAGNQGIYYSGNGAYVSNAANSSGGIVTGATNISVSGQTLYAAPTGSASTNLYAAGIAGESFGWSTYAQGLVNPMATDINAIYGSSLFFAQKGIPLVFYCTVVSNGNGCNQEGQMIPGQNNAIQALAYTNLGTLSSGRPLSGLVAGAANGLWVESGALGSPFNNWESVVYTIPPNTVQNLLSNSVLAITADASFNLYIADSQGNIYFLPTGGSNNAALISSWSALLGQTIKSMVYDNAGQKMYVADSTGIIYACPINGNCTSIGPSVFTGSSGMASIKSLNIITSFSTN